MQVKHNKTQRMDFRLSQRQKELLVKAASIKDTEVSDFIRENACKAAYEVLANQHHFTLPPDQWAAFCDAMDAPVKDIPSLRKLLTEPGIFDAPK